MFFETEAIYLAEETDVKRVFVQFRKSSTKSVASVRLLHQRKIDEQIVFTVSLDYLPTNKAFYPRWQLDEVYLSIEDKERLSRLLNRNILEEAKKYKGIPKIKAKGYRFELLYDEAKKSISDILIKDYLEQNLQSKYSLTDTGYWNIMNDERYF
ncbi:hypothetical protein [Lactococcus termiticola]